MLHTGSFSRRNACAQATPPNLLQFADKKLFFQETVSYASGQNGIAVSCALY